MDTIEDFKTRGFVRIKYSPKIQWAIEQVAASWKVFCALPPEVKKSLPYSNNADGVGYEFKNGVGKKADRKENFDIALGGQAWLEENIEKIDDPVALQLLRDALMLVRLMKPLIVDFAMRVEQTFDIPGFAQEVAQSERGFFIRLIHYFGEREVDEETASAHTDQSGFTPHLFQDAPGLQCKTYDGPWIDMPVGDGETVIIPAMQMQLRSGGKLRALCHQVVATTETATKGRYSGVCFVQLKDTPKYDKERWGRLQEQTPGFNYDMSIEEFAQMFK